MLTMLEDNFWLTDEHMDLAQWLGSRQFQKVDAFHSVIAFEPKSSNVENGLKMEENCWKVSVLIFHKPPHQKIELTEICNTAKFSTFHEMRDINFCIFCL